MENSLLRRATGLNYELPLMTALRADINAYCGLALLIDASPLYSGLRGKHVVAVKGYSDDEVYYNEPYNFDDLGIYGEQHKSISAMIEAINKTKARTDIDNEDELRQPFNYYGGTSMIFSTRISYNRKYFIFHDVRYSA